MHHNRDANRPNAWPRVTRRRLFGGALAGGAAVTIASACGSTKTKSVAGTAPNVATSAPGAAVAATATPKRGGTLSRSLFQQFDSGLDPHPLQPAYTSQMTLFYQTPLRLNPRTIALEPELAQKWEQPDQTTYVFHLQPNVKFHNKPPANGRLMTADDMVFSLNRVRTNDPKFQNRLLLASVDQFIATDKATMRTTTKAPDASLLTNLASFSVAVLAPEVVDKAGKFATADTAVGTGAFSLQSMDSGGMLVVVARNPDYWKPGLPYLDGVRSIYFADQQSTYAAFRSGQILAASNPVPGADAKQLFDQQQGKDYIAEWYKDVSFTSVQPNLQRKPFDDPRVPMALRLMVDHREAVEGWAATWFGRGYLQSYLPAALDAWDYTEQEYTSKFLEFKQPKDDAIKEALSLLSAAGFSKQNPLKFAITGIVSIGFTKSEAELQQAQFTRFSQGAIQIGDMRWVNDQGQFNTVVAQGDFDYFGTNVAAAAPYDVDSWFSTFYRTGGGRNYGKYSDLALDQMLDKQRAIFDVNQRKAAVKDILAYMIDHAPYTSWSGRYLFNLASRKVHGWAPEGAAAAWGYNYEQVWMD